MTREDVIGNLIHAIRWNDMPKKEALEMAIKALEQEPVLDKIRAEIERQEKWLLQAGYNSYNVDIAFSSIKSVLTESEVHEC